MYDVQDRLEIHIWMQHEVWYCDKHGCLNDSASWRTKSSFLGDEVYMQELSGTNSSGERMGSRVPQPNHPLKVN